MILWCEDFIVRYREQTFANSRLLEHDQLCEDYLQMALNLSMSRSS